MKDSIISSKLNKPEISDKVIARNRLTDILNTYASKDLILISAYAGTGKSTLISSWLEMSNLPHIWYSLDSWDSDMQLFLSYLITGIRSINETVANDLYDLSLGMTTIGLDAFNRAFVSTLESIEDRFVLVLDDFHCIDNPDIEEFVKFLIDYCSSKVLITIITREDPTFAISKLRLKGRIIEFRDKDLRLTNDESMEFVKSYTDITLSDEDMTVLTVKTEGWAAGLQLSAISLEGQNDTHKFIEDFSGSNYYIVDYLLEEVLDHQDKELKAFMLNASLLDYFNSELCDYMMSLSTGKSKNFIDEMLKKNLFLIPVDQTRTWFRFHHLLKDILHQRLTSSASESIICNYHIRAGEYFKSINQYQSAIDHFLKGESLEDAAALIELMWADMDVELKAGPWINLARKLPESIIKSHPVLSLGYGWSLIDTGEIMGYDQWLSHAQDLYNRYNSGEKDGIIVVDKKQFETLPSSVASAMGYMSAAMGDTEGTAQYAKEALDTLSEGQHYKRGVTAMLLAIAHWSKYEFDEALSIIKQATADMEGEVNLLVKYSIKMVAAEINMNRGYLDEASRIIERCLIETEGVNITRPIIATFYMLMANISFLRGLDDEAMTLLDKSYDHGSLMSLIDWRFKYHRLSALVSASKSDFKTAIDHIEKSREAYTFNPLPDDLSLDIIEKSILLKQGSSVSLEVSDDIDYMNGASFGDMLHFMYIRLSIDHSPTTLIDVLNKAKELERIGAQRNINSLLVKAKVLQALSLSKMDKKEESNKLIHDALKIASKERYVRPFYDYMPYDEACSLLNTDSSSITLMEVNQSLDDPLTSRELDVLNLIALGKSNKDICDELFLALSTVKGYTQNIYGKLQVNRRTEAIAKAREIGLIK